MYCDGRQSYLQVGTLTSLPCGQVWAEWTLPSPEDKGHNPEGFATLSFLYQLQTQPWDSTKTTKPRWFWCCLDQREPGDVISEAGSCLGYFKLIKRIFFFLPGLRIGLCEPCLGSVSSLDGQVWNLNWLYLETVPVKSRICYLRSCFQPLWALSGPCVHPFSSVLCLLYISSYPWISSFHLFIAQHLYCFIIAPGSTAGCNQNSCFTRKKTHQKDQFNMYVALLAGTELSGNSKEIAWHP